ncbi:MAG TPA: antibiotic biosynthesis monooxygenase family protein [Candidatus Binatia bacterium]|jgi:heme-degrading monooxygenase HmoA
MFVVVYRWTVREGLDDQFQRAWATRTEEVRREMGGLGSRLHRSADGSWIAYAQWPSRTAWEAAGSAQRNPSAAQERMAAAILSHEVLLEMDLVTDLLVRTP